MQIKLTESRLPFAPLLLIAPFFFWGTAMVAMKGVIPNTTPLFMAGVRLLPAGILVVITGIIMGRPQPQGWKAWLWISLFALIDGAMFQCFLAQGLVRTGAGLGSVMIDSQPLAVALLSWWLFGEKIGLWGCLGLAIGVVGISLIGIPDDLILGFFQSGNIQAGVDLQHLFANGEWLMLMAALSMALGTVIVRGVCRYADPVTSTGWHLILGGLPLFVFSAATESQQWVNIDLSNWVALGYATVFGSAVAYGLFFYFASSGNLTSLSSLTFLTPVFALFFGNLFLSETLSKLQSIGVCLTLVSIYLINQRDVLTEKLSWWRPRVTVVGDAETSSLLPSSTQDILEISLEVRLPESESDML